MTSKAISLRLFGFSRSSSKYSYGGRPNRRKNGHTHTTERATPTAARSAKRRRTALRRARSDAGKICGILGAGKIVLPNECGGWWSVDWRKGNGFLPDAAMVEGRNIHSVRLSIKESVRTQEEAQPTCRKNPPRSTASRKRNPPAGRTPRT